MKINKYKISLYFIIGIGITVRLVQYFFNRGLWMDEASLGLAIIDTSISLFKPLPNLQVAPILFLLVERIAFLLLGSSELALRLFPLVCSLISIPFAYLFFRNLTNDKRTALIALTIFALAPSLIYYSSELKQYSVDAKIQDASAIL